MAKKKDIAESMFQGVPVQVNIPFRQRGESKEEFEQRMRTGKPSSRLEAELEQERLEEGAAEAAGS
jgi:hypothetical protein